jgi:hypothetical protein
MPCSCPAGQLINLYREKAHLVISSLTRIQLQSFHMVYAPARMILASQFGFPPGESRHAK